MLIAVQQLFAWLAKFTLATSLWDPMQSKTCFNLQPHWEAISAPVPAIRTNLHSVSRVCLVCASDDQSTQVSRLKSIASLSRILKRLTVMSLTEVGCDAHPWNQLKSSPCIPKRRIHGSGFVHERPRRVSVLHPLLAGLHERHCGGTRLALHERQAPGRRNFVGPRQLGGSGAN